jgi:hypothetical protein
VGLQPGRRLAVRGLQLIIVLSTTLVLLAIAGWGLWHIWQEQELPYEEMGQHEREEGTRRGLVLNLTANGDVFLRQYEFSLAWPEKGEREDAVMAFKDALRDILRADLDLAEALASGAATLLIHADAAAKPEHLETVRRACRESGISSIEVRTKGP